jgi:hypothetical protein
MLRNYIPPGRVRQIARLSTDIELLRNKIAALSTDLARLDATVERLGQERARGMTRGALDILRRAGRPMGLRALTVALMTEKGMETADPALVNRTMEKLRVSLTRQWQHGVVTREKGPGWSVVWNIAT